MIEGLTGDAASYETSAKIDESRTHDARRQHSAAVMMFIYSVPISTDLSFKEEDCLWSDTLADAMQIQDPPAQTAPSVRSLRWADEWRRTASGRLTVSRGSIC
jgi:hypothetical protein